jgi:hypothetical protein
MTSPAPFLARHFGDYTLVAQLSEDSLGTVYRALYSADERRFVRLRMFHPDAVSEAAIARAIHEHAELAPILVHDAVVSRPQLDRVDGVAFMTWDETAGWTLDTMLARVRALGIRIPAEYALLVAERVAACLEHAFRAAPDGRPTPHGLLWPGFVSISHDATVRVGGFAVADAVLPSLHTPKLLAEIGPYIAPEVRGVGIAGENSDVYSLGAILMELLTGRKPSLDAPSAELRAGDPRSDDLESFLKKCLSSVETRFASAVDAHRALQQLVTANPFSLYTANLALFLYKLLNPESQATAQKSDLESTNPVVVHGAMPPAPEAAPPPLPGVPGRRQGDAAADSEDVFPEGVQDGPVAMAAAALGLYESTAPRDEADDDALSEARRHARPPLPLLTRAWARPAATLAVAATVAIGAFLVVSQIHSIRGAAASEQLAAASGRLAVEAAATTARTPDPVQPARIASGAAPANAAPVGVAAAHSTARASGEARPAANKTAPKVRKELRKPAEELRLRAALARIEADRLNARETAGAIFVQGRTSEEEGERFLRERDYQAAQLAFSRAARLFQQAQELSWEERVRQADISPAK